MKKDCSRAVFYKFEKKEDRTQIYIGSTTQTLPQRLAKHKYDAKKNPNRKFYLAVDGKWDNWEMILIEKYPCNAEEELKKREGELIKEIGTLNIHITGRTKEESKKAYRENNREKLLLKHREYNAKKKAQQSGIKLPTELNIIADLSQ